MKKHTASSLLISGLFLLIIAASCSSKSANQLQKVVVGAVLDQTVKDLNKDCPKMIDKEVRIDKVMSPADTLLQYNYTLVNYAMEDMDTAAFNTRIQPELVSMMQTDTAFKLFADYNVTVAFQYSDKNGKTITKVSVPPSAYKKQ